MVDKDVPIWQTPTQRAQGTYLLLAQLQDGPKNVNSTHGNNNNNNNSWQYSLQWKSKPAMLNS